MAAEASADAQFPVYLALIKLAFEFSIDWLGKVNLFYILLMFTYVFESTNVYKYFFYSKAYLSLA